MAGVSVKSPQVGPQGKALSELSSTPPRGAAGGPGSRKGVGEGGFGRCWLPLWPGLHAAPGRFGGLPVDTPGDWMHARHLGTMRSFLLKASRQENVPVLMSAREERPGPTSQAVGLWALLGTSQTSPSWKHRPRLTPAASKGVSAPKHAVLWGRGGATALALAVDRQLPLVEASSPRRSRHIPSVSPEQHGPAGPGMRLPPATGPMLGPQAQAEDPGPHAEIAPSAAGLLSYRPIPLTHSLPPRPEAAAPPTGRTKEFPHVPLQVSLLPGRISHW